MTIMNTKICGAVSLLLLMSGAHVQAKITALPMIEIKKTDAQIQQICQQAKISCMKQDDGGLWQVKNGSTQQYYLIDARPQIVQLQNVGTTYKALNHWDFKNYQHHKRDPSDEFAHSGMTIFPALYPVNRQNNAIAILNNWSTGYSGGGAGEQIADFIMLQAQGKYQVAIQDMPFYDYSLIRACFSEADYKNSPHCHDETWQILRLNIQDVGKVYYQWTFNYSAYTWDAFQPKTSTTVEKTKRVMMPFSQK